MFTSKQYAYIKLYPWIKLYVEGQLVGIKISMGEPLYIIAI